MPALIRITFRVGYFEESNYHVDKYSTKIRLVPHKLRSAGSKSLLWEERWGEEDARKVGPLEFLKTVHAWPSCRASKLSRSLYWMSRLLISQLVSLGMLFDLDTTWRRCRGWFCQRVTHRIDCEKLLFSEQHEGFKSGFFGSPYPCRINTDLEVSMSFKTFVFEDMCMKKITQRESPYETWVVGGDHHIRIVDEDVIVDCF